jgi:hypothetical protein
LADDTYDPARVEQLRVLLRELAQRIIVLDAEGRLLEEPGALLKLLGDVRSELFRYEVRLTYDTPEVSEHRRIVGDASRPWSPDQLSTDEEEEGWLPPDVP